MPYVSESIFHMRATHGWLTRRTLKAAPQSGGSFDVGCFGGVDAAGGCIPLLFDRRPAFISTLSGKPFVYAWSG